MVSAPRTRQREKLGPDPAVRRQILAAATTTLREHGVDGLSIAAVLQRAALSTRAFYRHFGSKDELVAAVFLEGARAEKRRLKRRMAGAATAIEAVVAWIDGRLDLAFDERLGNDLRRLSLEAQSQTFASPGVVQPAYAEMLTPLREAIGRGLQDGVFHRVDPVSDAQFIHGVVWAGIDQHWAKGTCARDDLRRRIQRFCLRGLGVAPEVLEQECST
ncbi:TetR/AcrR family transcriptional regulator [Mycobacterium sp. 852002-10029_SCH5224772]|uniref:TetR/AcrR family transcriptional regulator n=1 Tax=Mycobacterium sp. 852002-10029_SCH5224772 TaxID=1834083 RepID=UPI0007FBB320|nr:TetR/AcrR family transcriptional regulator [Mycobacterium sp. 852002-10029_SCH5224772]OBE99618.1 TetR family transcriptional regulator [Mycobacterium sp. 852002-10029_SCH5224772]